MKPGDLIFIRGTQGIAAPIQKITHSPYTHIAGLLPDNRVFESQALRRTGPQPLETYRGVSDVYTCPELTASERDAIVRAVMQWIGTRYDYGLFGSLAVRHIFGDTVPIPLVASKRRHICTTLWTQAYRAVGIDLCPGIEYPTPGELAKSPVLKFVGSF